jgi:hypothetical protein
MGLDMYLKRKVYYGLNYEHNNTGKTEIIINDEKINHSELSSIEFNAAYWRKFNALHNYFVENIQEGNDDCKEYYIEQEDLEKIITLCKEDIEYLNTLEIKDNIYIDVDIDKLNLKPIGGFFFGSTDIDNYYYENLEDTIKQLTEALKEKGDFYYESSW